MALLQCFSKITRRSSIGLSVPSRQRLLFCVALGTLRCATPARESSPPQYASAATKATAPKSAASLGAGNATGDDSRALSSPDAIEPSRAAEPSAPHLLFPESVFPPPDPGAPHERSEQDGDGTWRSFFAVDGSETRSQRFEEGSSSDFGADWVRRIVIHPHEASRFQMLTVAAFDMRTVRVDHRPGKQDVVDVGHPELSNQAGLVPAEHEDSLVAIFNGGFQPRHGHWGMLSLGTQLVEPREDACTVSVMKDGTVRIGPWSTVEPQLTDVIAYRQTPPCLVLDGAIHPLLEQRDRRAWAGQHKDRKTRRRSVAGVSRDGRTLFFGVGSETEAEVLASGMVHLGAEFAAQLDINWNWTRLFLFEPSKADAGEHSHVVGALIDDMAKDRGEYIVRPSNRGFFYVRTRDVVVMSRTSTSKERP